MTRWIFIFFSCCFQFWALAQEMEKPSLNIEGFGYPDFGDNSRYADFKVSYRLTNSFDAELRGFYQRSLITERFRVPILLKKFITKKTYFLGGAQAEWDFRQGGAPPRVDILTGIGHEVKKGFLMEASFEKPLNNSNVTPLGTGKKGAGFLRLKSKFKF